MTSKHSQVLRKVRGLQACLLDELPDSQFIRCRQEFTYPDPGRVRQALEQIRLDLVQGPALMSWQYDEFIMS